MLQFETIQSQLAALEYAFAFHSLVVGRMITFNPKGIDWTVNATWTDSAANHSDMKKALRKGGYSSLNVYFVKNIGAGVEGYTPLPVPEAQDQNNSQEDSISNVWNDGCVVITASMPNGGSALDDPQGKVLVHEVGHWFGL
jgi:hypothetical protein